MHLLGECSELIRFWVTMAQFWPSSSKKWRKMGYSVGFRHYLKKYSQNPIQTCGVHLLGECSELIRFWVTFAKCLPSSGQKLLKIVVSDHHLNKYSCSPIQIWCVHLLGEYSELIRFWATLAKFWPSRGHKMTENDDFRPLSEKVFTQSNSNLVCTLTGWVLKIDSLSGHFGPLLAF